MATKNPVEAAAEAAAEAAIETVKEDIAAAEQAVEKVAEEVKAEVMKFVHMVRDALDGPTTATVHPAEVANMTAGGWTVADPQPEMPDVPAPGAAEQAGE